METSQPSRPFPSWPGWRRTGIVLLLSALFLAPCFWQPRIQAGDLSSHIYNSWLSQLIESGRIDGLVLVGQHTNVLFDLILARLFVLVGAEAAQRISVSGAVLLFIWGAFQFISAVAGRKPWHLMPCVAMFAYGWVFHMGFFNFYVSMALCLWALAAVWKGRGWRLPVAGGLLLVASTAHLLPVAWSFGLIAYLWLARRIAPRYRVLLTGGALAAMGCLHAVLAWKYVSRWSPRQFVSVTGADQVWVFESKYYLLLIALLAIWSVLFLNLLRQRGARRVVLGIPFQLCVLSAAIVTVLPNAVLLPGYQHALSYIAERMSLGVGISVCALLGTARSSLWHRSGLAAVAAAFFCFLYADERALNRFENELESVVAALPPGQKVINGITDTTSRGNALAHVIDRACVGRCYSYANYEPSTAQFRVRATGPNPYVTHRYGDSYAMQTGTYRLREADLPLLQVVLKQDGTLAAVPLQAGTLCSTTPVQLFPKWIVDDWTPGAVVPGFQWLPASL